jgi:hypothetical protein
VSAPLGERPAAEPAPDPLAELPSHHERSRTNPWSRQRPVHRLDRPSHPLPDPQPSSPSEAPSVVLPDSDPRWPEILPLAAVSAGCVAIGLYLRLSSSAGPVPLLPIWALFLGLGMVATLGVAWAALASSEESEDSSDSARAARPPAVPPFSIVDVSAGGQPSVVQRRGKPGPATSALVAPPEPSPRRRDGKRRSPPTPESIEEENERATSDEMLAEIDRLLGELKPERVRPRGARG